MNLSGHTDTQKNSFLSTEAAYFNSYKKKDLSLFKKELEKLKTEILLKNQTILFLCIGSDRATGDCFGPLVGEALFRTAKKRKAFKRPGIYGTLEHPVHAVNLETMIKQIRNQYQDPYIFALDASLGVRDHIGFITLGAGPLFPGIGVKKELPEIGDVSITGIVNENTDNGQHTLQTTRLSVVYHLAAFVSQALTEVFFS